MIVFRRKAVIPKDIYEVWKIVTSVEDAGWRSDLSRTKILNERQFVECTKKGDHTIFTVTAEETDRLWEFDLENNTMQRHGRGVFLTKGKETELDFTEQIHCKKLILRLFIKLYLKSQQSRYVSGLKKHCDNISQKACDFLSKGKEIWYNKLQPKRCFLWK